MEKYCMGKRQYSKKDALTMRNVQIKKGKAKDLRVYQCPFCNTFHLTKIIWKGKNKK